MYFHMIQLINTYEEIHTCGNIKEYGYDYIRIALVGK